MLCNTGACLVTQLICSFILIVFMVISVFPIVTYVNDYSGQTRLSTTLYFIGSFILYNGHGELCRGVYNMLCMKKMNLNPLLILIIGP